MCESGFSLAHFWFLFDCVHIHLFKFTCAFENCSWGFVNACKNVRGCSHADSPNDCMHCYCMLTCALMNVRTYMNLHTYICLSSHVFAWFSHLYHSRLSFAYVNLHVYIGHSYVCQVSHLYWWPLTWTFLNVCMCIFFFSWASCKMSREKSCCRHQEIKCTNVGLVLHRAPHTGKEALWAWISSAPHREYMPTLQRQLLPWAKRIWVWSLSNGRRLKRMRYWGVEWSGRL